MIADLAGKRLLVTGADSGIGPNGEEYANPSIY